jgi:hypothetical protein
LAKRKVTALKSSAGSDAAVASKVAAGILRFVGEIPDSDERKSRTPAEAARKAANKSACMLPLRLGRWLCLLAHSDG